MGVSFTCPGCRQRVGVESLGRHSQTLGTPFDQVGLLGGLFQAAVGSRKQPPEDAAGRSIQCPSCAASFPCADVIDLQGEVLFGCPHFKHRMLTGSLKAGDLICCEKCGYGFKGGLAVPITGSIEPVPPTEVVGFESPGQIIIVPYTCRQETFISKTQPGSQQTAVATLTSSHAPQLIQPKASCNTYKHHCPSCGQMVNVAVWSVDAARARQKRRVLWGLPAVLLLAGMICYRLFIHTDRELGSFELPGWILAVLWFVYLLAATLQLIVASFRRSALAGCIEFTENPFNKELWDPSITKTAKLQVSHAFAVGG